MGLSNTIERATRNMGLATNGFPNKRSTIETVRDIGQSVFSNGVGLVDASYIVEIADALDIEHDIVTSDYYDGHTMAHVLTFSETVREVLSVLNKVK